MWLEARRPRAPSPTWRSSPPRPTGGAADPTCPLLATGWAWWRTRVACSSWRVGRRPAAPPAPWSRFSNPERRAESRDQREGKLPPSSGFPIPQSGTPWVCRIGRSFLAVSPVLPYPSATFPCREPTSKGGRMSSLRRRLLGEVCLFVAAAIRGGMYVVSKYVLDYIPPMTLLAIRLVIGGAALLLVMVASRSPWVGVRDLPRMALLGFVGFGISLAAQFIGTRLSSASHGAVITSVTPAFILVFSATLLKHRITWAKLAAVADR